MAENLGSIRYDVEVNTAGALQAEKVIDSSMKNVEKDFQRVEAASTKAATTISAQSKKSATAINTQMTQVAKSTKGASFQAANFSYQIQDIAVQAQMGTSPLVIFAQQFPQMAVGMGAAAGAIGAAVAILGALGTAVIDTSTSMDRLQKAIEKVQAVITIGAGGVANYSEEMQKLNTISEVLTRIKLQNALAEQAAALKEVSGVMREAWKEAGTLFDQTSSGVVSEIISDKDQKKLKDLAKDFNYGKIGAEEFNKEVGNIKAAMSGVDLIDKGIKNLGYSSKEAQEQGVQQLVEGLGLLSGSAAQNTKAGRELTSTVTDLAIKYKEGKLTLDALRDSLSGTTDSFDKNADTIKNLTNEFVLNAIRLSEGERAAFKFGLQLQGLDNDQVKAQLSLYDYNKELEKNAEASKSAAKIKSDAIDKEIDGYIKIAEQIEKADKTEKRQSKSFAEGIIERGLTEPERYAAEIEELELLRAKDLENKELYDEAIAASAEKRRDALIAANEKELQSQALFNQAQSQLLGSLGNLIGAYADNMEVEDKKSFEKKKKFQTAQALINTAMAISNALAAAPPPINFALAAASGAMGAIQVAAIQGQEYSGGREFGGPVSSGSMYRVGEKGKPEFYKDNLGNLSMIPGENGEVIPANKMGGSGSGMTVQVNNYTPYQVYVTQDQATSIAKVEIGNEAGKLQKGRGNMYNAMKSGGNYSNNAKR
tara:strand:+ start:1767 stop:3896 length:2130 start_codon:yes stop_codon:yes gene_type:complete